jgi:hypothetical protein
VIFRDAVRVRFQGVPGDVIDLSNDNLNDPNVKRYRKDVKDLCTNLGALQRWEFLQSTLHDYGMAIYDHGRVQDGRGVTERTPLQRDSNPVRDWCKLWLKELVRLYRIQFVELLLSKHPVLQCGHFRQRPLACFTKYANEFTTKMDFLDLGDACLKKLFLEGIPDASASFREYLCPFVDNHDMTLMQMIAIGRDELKHNSEAHVSIRHTRRRINP